MGKLGGDASKSKLYSLTSATLSISELENAVATQVEVQYTRQLQPILTIGQGVHYAAQPPQGTLTCSLVASSSSNPLSLGGNECLKTDITVSTGQGCDLSGITFVCKQAILSSIGATISAQQGYVASNVQWTFSELA